MATHPTGTTQEETAEEGVEETRAVEEEQRHQQQQKQVEDGSRGSGGKRKAELVEDVEAGSAEEAAQQAKLQGRDGETHGYEPVTLAFKTFSTPEQMYRYFSWLLNNVTLDQNLNEYEHRVLEDLLRVGHHNAQSKIGPGIKALQARAHTYYCSKSFFVVRPDGSYIDFSYRKCIENLMPTEAGQRLLRMAEEKKRKKQQQHYDKRPYKRHHTEHTPSEAAADTNNTAADGLDAPHGIALKSNGHSEHNNRTEECKEKDGEAQQSFTVGSNAALQPCNTGVDINHSI